MTAPDPLADILAGVIHPYTCGLLPHVSGKRHLCAEATDIGLAALRERGVVMTMGDALAEARMDGRAEGVDYERAQHIGAPSWPSREAEWAKWIVQTYDLLPTPHRDWACSGCHPESDMLVAGFVCCYHQAAAVLVARLLPSESGGLREPENAKEAGDGRVG